MSDQFCCTVCIGDMKFTTLFEGKTVAGTCHFCKAKKSDLINPISMRDHFEFLLYAYNEDDTGKSLSIYMKNDWLLFPKLTESDVSLLLVEIFDDAEIVRKKYKPKLIEDEHALGWLPLKEELMTKNRFFPTADINLDRIKELFSHVIIKSEDLSEEEWFRARVQKGTIPYTHDIMGAPPPENASAGRANPIGIPYLYLASDTQTTVNEVRPHTGDIINVAEFKLDKGLTLIDLRNPRKAVSPFYLENEEDVSTLRRDIALLETLGKELKKPVLPKNTAIQYLPTQYLCEFMKVNGYDGVLFNSSVGEGKNLALFNPSKATCIEEVKTYEVLKVNIEID